MSNKNFKVKNGLDVGNNITILEDGTITGLDTDNLAEGTTNEYYTNAKADARVAIGIANLVDSAPGTLDTLNELAAALGDDANFATTVTTALGTKLATADFTSTANTWLGTKTTTNLAENGNLYYTDVRARAALSATDPIGYNTTTGAITFTPTPTLGSLLTGNGTTWTNATIGVSSQYILNRNSTGATGSNNVLVFTKTRTDGARTNGQGPIQVFNYIGTDGGYNFARIQSGYQSGGAHTIGFSTSTDTSGAFGAGTSTPLTFSKSSGTFTFEGGFLISNRTGAVAAQVPAQVVRYSRTDVAGPTDSDGVDFRLGVGGTSTNTNVARFDAVYKSSGLNEIGMSVSTDSFSADTDRIYVGTRESTKIRCTPAGGGTVSETANFTQLSTTIKSDMLTLLNAAGTSLPSGKVTYARQYGSFFSNAAQPNPVANAVNLMTYNNTDLANGISVVSNSRLTASNAGQYNIQFSSQFQHAGGGAATVYIWLRKNGVSVADSAADITLVGNGAKQLAAWNFVVDAAANDYFEIAWQSSDLDITMTYVTASGNVPGAPSVAVTMTPVGA